MPNFLRTCHCQGYAPEGVDLPRRVSRADLIALMLRDRTVARFIVAPPGYGRTALASEYADIVFGFRHVFWVDCTSPCFLRDLDAGTLVEGMRAIDAELALVVWDDVPHLGADRAEAFAALLDGLLESGVEVMAVCTPVSDVFATLQRDRTLLTAADLMLSSAEMRHEAASGRLHEGWEASCIPADHTPCIRWGKGGERLLMEGMVGDEVPAELRLAALVVLALVRGTVDDVAAFLPGSRAEELCGLLADQYPFLGIDMRSGLFCTIEAPIDQMAAVFRRRLDACVEPSAHGSRDALCEHLADALVMRGQATRGAQLAGAFLAKEPATRWLARNGYRMLLAGGALPFVSLHERVRRRAATAREDLAAMRGWAWLVLGEERRAAADVRRVAASGTASLRTRIVAALTGLRSGTASVRSRMVELLREHLVAAGAEPLAANEAMELTEEGMDWRCLAALALRLAEEPQSTVELWLEQRSAAPKAVQAAAARRNALLLAAAWMLDEAAACEPGALGPQEGIDKAARYIRTCTEHEAANGALGWCAATAASALERVAASDPRYAAYLPAAGALAQVRKAEVALFAQREEARSLFAGGASQAKDAVGSEPYGGAEGGAAEAPPAGRPTSMPTLRVRLFGGLQVSVGGVTVRPRELNRHKTRILLAVLVLNHGREISRRRLAEALWPMSQPKSAMKNFYSVWSQLRRALTVDGACPYLVRTQEGCRLDPHLVDTDIAGFEVLLRDLTLPKGKEDWSRMYDLVCTEYGEDLLPCDLGNDLVNSLRRRYHAQLVDALLAASQRLWRAGEDRGSLWFVREAVRRDPCREDACILLMDVLRQLDQRPEALEAYFTCRRCLSEELGIDPSERLMALYRSIIESEQPLD